ncbi:hypothetical protein K0M31_016386 [Melipona bicolor]|uniref:Acyltransferase n=2 Tax=Melipona bicolor TaxID=60889 RepID=A0AA40G731_9HYME|nr:hypothetical protein K0M31_016386 [Melipona bicolor]
MLIAAFHQLLTKNHSWETEDEREAMEIFGIKFTPLEVVLQRYLEMLATMVTMCGILLLSKMGYLLAIYLFFYSETSRYCVLFYFIWIYYDNYLYPVGGRRSQFKQWLRTCTWNRYVCNYFPIKLVKTTDLDPKKSYLFCNFPHGIMCCGVYGAFATDAIGFRELFPGLDINIIMLDQFFKTPFLRDYVRVINAASSSPESMNLLLSTKPEAPYTGNASVLMPGGAAEIIESKPGTYRILIKRRKGFVRLSLKNGVSMVPVCSFGETNVYNQITFPEGSFMKKVMNFIRKILGLPPFFLIGRGLSQNYFGFIPRRTPITVVVGSPMHLPKIENPTDEQINEYHKKFVDHLVDFFEKEKYKYVENADSVHLEFV